MSASESQPYSRSSGRRAPRWVLFAILLTWLLLGCQVLFGGVTVNPASTTDAECALGEFRCNGEYLLSCDAVDTGWSLKSTCASGDLCDAKDKRCSVCKDGDFRCSGAERQQCNSDGNGWHTVETCDAQNLCSESSCNGCVTNGQLDCSLGSQLRQCKSGVWVTLEMCASRTLCTATMAYATTVSDWDQKCLVPGCPEAGKYQCAGAILQRCPPERDAWVTVDTCNNNALCEGAVARVNGASDPNSVATLDMCTPACPTPNGFMCDGSSLRQCRADQTAWDTLKDCPADTECDPIAGDCGKLCKEGQYQCNGTALRKCAKNGHWVDEAQCETAALCSVSSDSNTGSCAPSPCGKNDYACNGAVLQKCKADRTGYEDNTTCASAALCDAPSARCITPTCMTANAYQCFGQDLKQCASDLTKWNAIKSCPTGQFCDSGPNAGCLTACPANPLRCNGKVLEHCAAATGWTTQATCSTNDLCSCALTDPDGSGPLSNSCLNGLYKDGCGNVVCGAPLANFQCNGADLQKCQAGRNGWDKVSSCGAQNLCYPGEAPSYTSGYCLACPEAGELSCSGSTLRVCSSDRRSWNTSQTCGLGCMTVSSAQDYCAACKAGTVQCAGQTLQSCPADQKAFQNQTCANLCDATNAQCDQCSANSYWCVGAALNKCSADGQSQTTTNCPSSALCNAGAKKCDACASGQRQCSGSNSQICNSDKSGFVNGTDCGTPGCNTSTNNCYACATGQRQCKGSNSQICNSDKSGFVDDTACGTPGCNSTTNSCNVCIAGQHKCQGNNSQVCNSDKTGFVNDTDCGTPGCNTSTNSCYACSTGQRQCKGGNSQICNADKSGFVDDTACGAPGCNATTNACNACTTGQHKCQGNNSQVCNSDKSGFVDDVDCGAPGCNTSSNTCNACATGEHKCQGNNSQICNAAKSGFVNDTNCGMAGCNTSTNLCNPALACTPMAYQCAGDGGLSLEQCNAAGTAWAPAQTCSTICDAAHGECDECAGTAYKCAGNVLQDCSATGHWETLQDCMTATCNPAGTCDASGGAGSGNGGSSGAGAPGAGAANGGASSGGAPSAGAPSAGAPSGNGGAASISGP